jgi:acetyl-CoA acetyltransferase
MSRAVILSAVRTPVGRYGGVLAGERPDDLAALVIAEAVSRAGVPADAIEDVYFGAANQAGEDNRNVARMAALLAGLPDSVAGVTVNRLCASGLSAVVSACHAVVAGDGDLFVAGGVESMSRAPLVMAKPDAAFPRGNRTAWDTTLGWRFPNPRLEEQFPLESITSPSATASHARSRTRSRCSRSNGGPRLMRPGDSRTSWSRSERRCVTSTQGRTRAPRGWLR